MLDEDEFLKSDAGKDDAYTADLKNLKEILVSQEKELARFNSVRGELNLMEIKFESMMS